MLIIRHINSMFYREGLIARVLRRLSPEECQSTIKSGTIIVYTTTESGTLLTYIELTEQR